MSCSGQCDITELIPDGYKALAEGNYYQKLVAEEYKKLGFGVVDVYGRDQPDIVLFLRNSEPIVNSDNQPSDAEAWEKEQYANVVVRLRAAEELRQTRYSSQEYQIVLSSHFAQWRPEEFHPSRFITNPDSVIMGIVSVKCFTLVASNQRYSTEGTASNAVARTITRKDVLPEIQAARSYGMCEVLLTIINLRNGIAEHAIIYTPTFQKYTTTQYLNNDSNPRHYALTGIAVENWNQQMGYSIARVYPSSPPSVSQPPVSN